MSPVRRPEYNVFRRAGRNRWSRYNRLTKKKKKRKNNINNKNLLYIVLCVYVCYCSATLATAALSFSIKRAPLWYRWVAVFHSYTLSVRGIFTVITGRRPFRFRPGAVTERISKEHGRRVRRLRSSGGTVLRGQRTPQHLNCWSARNTFRSLFYSSGNTDISTTLRHTQTQTETILKRKNYIHIFSENIFFDDPLRRVIPWTRFFFMSDFSSHLCAIYIRRLLF